MAACLTASAIEPIPDIWGEYTIGIVGQATQSPLDGPARAGMEAALAELEKEYRIRVTLIHATPREADPAEQAKALRQISQKSVDGILLDPVNNPAVAEGILFLKSRDIPTVFYNRTLAGSPAIGQVTTSQELMGKTALETLIPRLGRLGGNIVGLTGPPDDPITAARMRGLGEVELPEDIVLMGFIETRPTMGPAIRAVQTTHKDDRDERIDGWLFLGSWPLLGSVPLPWKPGERHCVAIGHQPQMLHYLDAGTVDALVMPDTAAIGARALEILVTALHKPESGQKTAITIPPIIVTPQNLDEIREKWVQWLR